MDKNLYFYIKVGLLFLIIFCLSGLPIVASGERIGPARITDLSCNDCDQKGPVSGLTSYTTSSIGNIWKVNEIDQYFGTWTRRPGTNTFDAKWTDARGNHVASDIIDITSVQGTHVVLYRRGVKGYYGGNIQSDGTISGTAGWYQPGWIWKAKMYAR